MCKNGIRKNTNRGIAPILLVLVLIVVFGGVFFAYRQVKISTFDDTRHNQELTERDDTKNWKTYRNEEYGFEFQYPVDFTIEQNDGDGSTPEIRWIRVYCNRINSWCWAGPQNMPQGMDVYIYTDSAKLSVQTIARITDTLKHKNYHYSFATRQVYQYSSDSPIEYREMTIDPVLKNQIISTLTFTK